MINLHLLTKASGFDYEFRCEVIAMIESRFKRVSEQTQSFIEQKRWTACYLHLEHYLCDLQPYSEAEFITDLQRIVKAIRQANSDQQRMLLAKRFLNSVELGLLSARSDIEKRAS